MLDVNGNGVVDAGDRTIETCGIYLDLNGDLQLNPGEPFVASTFNGYRIDVPQGVVTLRLIPQEGTIQELPVLPDGYVISVPNDKNFGATRDFLVLADPAATASISGSVFDDSNVDGLREASEPGLADINVYVDANGNGVHDAYEMTTRSGVDGTYHFSNLLPGLHAVRVDSGDLSFQPTSLTAGTVLTTLNPDESTTNIMFPLATPKEHLQADRLTLTSAIIVRRNQVAQQLATLRSTVASYFAAVQAWRGAMATARRMHLPLDSIDPHFRSDLDDRLAAVMVGRAALRNMVHSDFTGVAAARRNLLGDFRAFRSIS